MISPTLEFDLRSSIRTIPDYPKPGIMFRDITTLLGNARAFRRAVDEMVQPWAGMKIDKVAGMEARGFILGGAVAHQVSAGFIPIRKKGKLPHKRVSIAYSLEYGLDEMEMHEDAVTKGEKVILVDDLIATGGTAEGAVKLLQAAGRRRARRLLHHRPAGTRRRRQDPQARRAGAHADRVRGALKLRDRVNAERRQLAAGLAEQQPQLQARGRSRTRRPSQLIGARSSCRWTWRRSERTRNPPVDHRAQHRRERRDADRLAAAPRRREVRRDSASICGTALVEHRHQRQVRKAVRRAWRSPGARARRDRR